MRMRIRVERLRDINTNVMTLTEIASRKQLFCQKQILLHFIHTDTIERRMREKTIWPSDHTLNSQHTLGYVFVQFSVLVFCLLSYPAN